MQPQLMLIGGFLGAGKTTLIAAAARILRSRGLQVGIVTNDQAPQLVDSAMLRSHGLRVGEVAGGCFCCRFDRLIEEFDGLAVAPSSEVIIAEPVGSCTDLSATVLQPLKQLHGDRWRVLPYTVVVDPDRLNAAIGAPGAANGMPPEVLHIFRTQLEEADVILLNKVDLLSSAHRDDAFRMLSRSFPHALILAASALTGEGLEAWLSTISWRTNAGNRIADVDYNTYTIGEAALGWLNAGVDLRAIAPAMEFDAGAAADALMGSLRDALKSQGAEAAHIKAWIEPDSPVGLVTSDDDRIVISLTSTAVPPRRRGRFRAQRAALTLNARVVSSSETLHKAVLDSVAGLAPLGIEAQVRDVDCFSPSRRARRTGTSAWFPE